MTQPLLMRPRWPERGHRAATLAETSIQPPNETHVRANVGECDREPTNDPWPRTVTPDRIMQ